MEYFIRRLRGEFIIMCRYKTTEGFFRKKEVVVEKRVNLFGGPFHAHSIILPMQAFKSLEEAKAKAKKLNQQMIDFDINGNKISTDGRTTS